RDWPLSGGEHGEPTEYDCAVVHRPRLLELREEGRRGNWQEGRTEGPGPVYRGDRRADRKGRRGAAWQEGGCRAQVLSRLRSDEGQSDRRGHQPGQEYAEGDGFPRRGSRDGEAGSDHQ